MFLSRQFAKRLKINYFNSVKYLCSARIYDSEILEKLISNINSEMLELQSNQSSANMKKIQELRPLLHIIDERSKIISNLSSVKELLEDEDEGLRKLAEEESKIFQSKLSENSAQLIEAALPIDKNDFATSLIVEISAGVGGQEAMLFASELFDMYKNFAYYKGWNYFVAQYDESDIGGLRHASLIIEGRGIFKYFKHEAGVHRVQRIPATEKSGRIHTSTVSVTALPQPSDVDVQINDKDLRIETKRASGAGGQHVNTTDSAVRIVHLPTGISVDCQTDRSQIRNREIAMQRLRAKLYEQQIETQLNEAELTKKSQVRSNYRNEKIRTYNFSQDRITDHRLQSYSLHNLKAFMTGNGQLEELILKLQEQFRRKEIENLVASLK